MFRIQVTYCLDNGLRYLRTIDLILCSGWRTSTICDTNCCLFSSARGWNPCLVKKSLLSLMICSPTLVKAALRSLKLKSKCCNFQLNFWFLTNYKPNLSFVFSGISKLMCSFSWFLNSDISLKAEPTLDRVTRITVAMILNRSQSFCSSLNFSISGITVCVQPHV